MFFINLHAPKVTTSNGRLFNRHNCCYHVLAVVLFSAIFGTALGCWATQEDESDSIAAGVVVSRVGNGSAAKKAGLQEGDVILGWTRADVHGKIGSPADLYQVEINEIPLGPITLEGARDGQSKTWVMPSARWRLPVRPNFSPLELSRYEQCQTLITDKHFSEATNCFQDLSAKLSSTSQPWLSGWILFSCAEQLAEANESKLADGLYSQAVAKADVAGALVEVQFLVSWAETLLDRNEFKNAKSKLEAALPQARRLGSDTMIESLVQSNLGLVTWTQDDLMAAEQYHLQALAIRTKLAPGSMALASTLENLGNIASKRSELAKAEEYYKKVLEIREKQVPGSGSVAAILMNLSTVYHDRGDLDLAEEALENARLIWQKLAPENIGMARVLNNLGLIANLRGEFLKAEDCYLRALAIKGKADSGSLDYASTLENLAENYNDEGKLQLAEQYHLKALALTEKVSPGSLGSATVFENLGQLAEERFDYDMAEFYIRKALAIRSRQTPNNLAVAVGYQHLGRIALGRDKSVQAEKLYASALRLQKDQAPESVETAWTLYSLADLALETKVFARADQYLRAAKSIVDSHAPKSLLAGVIAVDSGRLAEAQGHFAEAENLYQQALALWHAVVPGTGAEADTLFLLASLYRRQERLQEAASLFNEAINTLDNQTNLLGGSLDVRSKFRAGYSRYYTEYIDLLLAENNAEQAFQVLERSRARTLLEALKAAHVDVQKGADESLRNRELLLQQKISAKSTWRLRMLTGQHSEAQMAALDKELKALLDEYHAVQDAIRSNSPGYSALTRPQPLSLSDIQHQLLDDNTILLEYSLGEKRSYLFAVTLNSLNVYSLPERTKIEEAVRHVRELLEASGKNSKPPGLSPGRASNLVWQRNRAIAELSHMVLGPVADHLGAKRLAIVRDGSLQLLPFTLLTLDRAGRDFLVAKHEMINLPSASVLASLRTESASRKGVDKDVVIIADPVFESGDPRIKRTATQSEVRTSRLESNDESQKQLADAISAHLRSIRDFRLRRLPFTKLEAERITAVTPPGKAATFLGFNATRSLAMSPVLAEYRIVHFATHGLIDDKNPELSGLVFSLYDRSGQPRDGFLQLQDIYNLNIPVDTVVLSSCESGVGKHVEGEGLMSLTRGFMYAGATRVVASLWKVSDAATAELMSRFYDALERKKLSPSAALRKAQMEMLAESRWKSPYYWAAFEIHGDWR